MLSAASCKSLRAHALRANHFLLLMEIWVVCVQVKSRLQTQYTERGGKQKLRGPLHVIRDIIRTDGTGVMQNRVRHPIRALSFVVPRSSSAPNGWSVLCLPSQDLVACFAV